MCELLAMSASRPAGMGSYLSRLMPRGGRTGPHADGWGVAYYEGRAARVFKDPAPAAESHVLATLARQEVKSTLAIAHIRRANPAAFGRATANTHPFEREWGGRSWVFAHNGKLPGLQGLKVCPENRFRPLGETDSELAFCYILDAIARHTGQDEPFTPAQLVGAIQPVVEELSTFGEFNFVLSDGECLYVHAHTRLHLLQRTIFSGAAEGRMAVLATVPLTDEPWMPLAKGSIHVYRQGTETPVESHAIAAWLEMNSAIMCHIPPQGKDHA